MPGEELGKQNEKNISGIQKSMAEIKETLVELTVDTKYIKKGFDEYKIRNTSVQEACNKRFEKILTGMSKHDDRISNNSNEINNLHSNYRSMKAVLDKMLNNVNRVGWIVIVAVLGAILKLVIK